MVRASSGTLVPAGPARSGNPIAPDRSVGGTVGGMTRPRMHADEIVTDPGLLHRLLSGQFPQWAELPVRLVESSGTDHDIYRLGKHLAARLPRLGGAAGQATHAVGAVLADGG